MDVREIRHTAVRKLLETNGWRELSRDRYESGDHRFDAFVEAEGSVVVIPRGMKHTITFSPAAFARWIAQATLRDSGPAIPIAVDDRNRKRIA